MPGPAPCLRAGAGLLPRPGRQVTCPINAMGPQALPSSSGETNWMDGCWMGEWLTGELVDEWKDGWMELKDQWMDRLMDRQMTG